MRHATFGFILLFFWSIALGTTFYVDFTNGDDTYNGLATTYQGGSVGPWKRIPWDPLATGTSASWSGSMYPGDVIALAPDTTYTGADIEVNDSGGGDDDSLRIILTGDPTTWGSGTNNAVMEGTPGGAYEGIIELKYGTNKYISIQELTIQNVTTGMAITVDMQQALAVADYLKIKNVIVDNCDGAYGIYIHKNIGTLDNVTIDGVTVKNCAGTGLQIDDCGSDLVIKNSTFNNNGAGGNQDGLLIQNTEGFLVQDCVAHTNGGGGTDGSGFDCSDESGNPANVNGTFERCYSYNNDNCGFSASCSIGGNVVTWRNCIAYDNDSWGNFIAYENITAKAYNCTSGDSTAAAYHWDDVDGNPNGEMKNCIAYGTYAYAVRFNGTGTFTSNFNCINDGSTALVDWKGSDKTWAQWQALGYDGDSLHEDPVFDASPALPDDDYYGLQATSPCLEAGTDLSATGFTDDYDSVTRPQNTDWDIGAYEDVVANVNPNTPTITVDSYASTTAEYSSSAFSDDDAGDTHQASQWQTTTAADTGYASTVDDSGTDTTNLTSYSVTGLSNSTAYICRVRHQDSESNWSSYSDNGSFTTDANTVPSTPTITHSNVTDTTADLSSSAFSDSDSEDTHAGSQWLTDDDENFGSVDDDSGDDASNLTSYTVTGLTAGTTYYSKVRHKDSQGGWSSYSTATSYTPQTSEPPLTPTINSITVSHDYAYVNCTPYEGYDTHGYTIVRVSTNSSVPVRNSALNITYGPEDTIPIPLKDLAYDTTYYVKVRYGSVFEYYSSWSAIESFSRTKTMRLTPE